jgi:hypothetical protein
MIEQKVMDHEFGRLLDGWESAATWMFSMMYT